MPVITDAHTGSGWVGRVVARCIDAPRSSSRPKFGSRPAATAGEITSSEAPSRQSTTTRAPEALSGSSEDREVTFGGGRTLPARSQSGTTIDAIVAIVNRI